jgi:hypothetical protein
VSETMTAPHLWEVDHPYYATEGNYRCPGTRWDEVHFEFDTWQEFYEEWGDSDPDMNLVYRWDWKVYDPADYSPEDDEEVPAPELLVFFVMQRKADHRSAAVKIREEDEPAVRAWLTERARTIAAIWAPILPPVPTEETR